MIQLKGDYLEGGGQLVRTALALSALTGKPFEVNDVRKGRKVPGLKAQHIHCVEALQKLCNAKAEGVELGSTQLKFEPGKIEPKTVSVDIGTAGSVSLLLQSILLPAMLAGGKVRLKIRGGTSGKWAMPFDFFNEVLVPQLRRWADIDCKLVRRGYYPKGGGEVDIKIKGKHKVDNMEGAAPIPLVTQGHLLQIKGVSHASSDLEKAQVAERQARAAKSVLSKLNVPVQIVHQYSETLSTGSGITLWAIFSLQEDDVDVNNPIRLGADALGEPGKRAEVVGEEAAKKLLAEIESGATVDSHTADNLIPFIAVFGGQFRTSEITQHAKTGIYVVQQFLGDCIELDEDRKNIKNKEVLK
ncbi:RNA 3'-terminal phosphate cyclase [Candidatus Woesearchaeota archaeon]|nr:RNA 3'-terminal phosphate cyclase [Candidatus Woesearchaeota archaeon]